MDLLRHRHSVTQNTSGEHVRTADSASSAHESIAKVSTPSEYNEEIHTKIEVPVPATVHEHDIASSAASSMSSLGRIYNTAQLMSRVNSTFEEIITPTWSPRPSVSPASSMLNLSSRASLSSIHTTVSHSVHFSSSHGSLVSLASEAASETSMLAPEEPYVVEVDFFDGDDARELDVEGGKESDVEDGKESDAEDAKGNTNDGDAASANRPDAGAQTQQGLYVPPPKVADAQSALDDIKALLMPRKPSGKGRKTFDGDDVLRTRMEMIRMHLWTYVSGTPPSWIDASFRTANAHQRGYHLARQLRGWTRDFIADRHKLPVNTRGGWNASALDDEAMELAVSEHLQGIGKHVRALDIVEFLADPDVQKRFGLKKTIGLSTAQGWMHRLRFRWSKTPSGQYVDGHEREDVVKYRCEVFLPALEKLRPLLRQFNTDGEEVIDSPNHDEGESAASPPIRRTVIWWHDESTFYANDRRKVRWVHEGEKAVPQAKGEGASLMVSDFVSAEYGWLRAKDGGIESVSARRLFRPGKNRDGYYTNEDILDQVKTAGDLAKHEYPDDDHVFIFDNAPTHLKRASDALSARTMPKKPSNLDSNFGVDVPVMANGKPVYGTDGKIQKERRPMADAVLPDGTPQSLYYPVDHPDPALRGAFKGMAKILEERGYQNTDRLKAQCTKFQCPKPPNDTDPFTFYSATPCCCRRLLYHQPDFSAVKSSLELLCEEMGIGCLFIPKFHCELNPIEQCWGYAKRIYRMNPASKKEADLEKNLVNALEAVPLKSIRR